MAAEFQGTTRFQIRRRIGAGGMGVVYEAFDRERQQPIALKTLRTPSPDAILRLKNEFRALQEVQHRNLVHLGELFEENGTWFFTMELIEGQPLLSYLRPDAPRDFSPEATALTDQHMTRPTMAPLPARAAAPGPASAAASSARAARPTPFPVPVPVASAFDEARVRDVLAQLARGLSALHRAGKVHRDVKPSNILVDRGGRVVLLDFGLVADAERGPALTEVGVVGTAAYMAPEQALGKPVGPEADWYSLGVLLYEALTGTLPFQGSTLHILMEKQRLKPSRPVTHIADVPADLDRMCVELLEFDPQKRPTGAAILRRLGVVDGATSSLPPLATRSVNTITQAFVGREKELAELASALAEVREGRLVSAFVKGESGIGKSALVDHFCKRAALDERVVLLAGRCYERETVRYRLLDGVIDALARYIQRLPKPEAAALTPARVSLLLQVFPVLKRVDVFADAPRHDTVDPQELRARAFGALRELFARLSDRRTLIVAIDDLQWADVDGLELLGELMRPPDAPAFLLVGSWRDLGEDPRGVEKALAALPGEAHHIRLDHLPDDSARELAERLLVHAGIADQRLAAQARLVAREAHGHPLYIDELVRYSAVPETDSASRPFRLEDVLWARIARLDPISRRVLEVVAVAGAPIEQESAARAADLDLGTLGRHAALLRVANLVRTTGSRSTDTVEPYHDRVRHAILTHLGAEARVARHREIARALDSSGRADPEDLMEHYRGAHEPLRAAQCATQAAANAATALAFDQAARLYQLALTLLPDDDPATRRGLRVQLGDALASAGRGHEAAQAYLDGAEGAGSAERLELQLRAAQQLLLTGHIDAGVAIVRSFLESEGIGYPRSPRHALMMLLARRAQLALRGLGYTERDESSIAPRDLKRLDVCFSVGVSLALVDNVTGQAFHARGLLLALRAGEPVRLARALVVEAAGRAAAGGKRVAAGNRTFAAAEKLLAPSGNVQVLALAAACRAQSTFLCGQFRTALETCERARAILGERCVGAAWERTAIDLYTCRALHWLGDLDRLAGTLPDLLREFRRCNNQYAVTSLGVTVAPFLHLADDAPGDVVRAEVAEAMGRWSPTGFHIQHYQAILAEASTRLYHGDAAGAYAHLQESWEKIERSFLLRVQFIRVVLHDLRARSAAAAAEGATGKERAALVACAAKDVARLRKEDEPWAVALADASEAGLLRLRGDGERARARLTAALAGFEAAEMCLHVAAAHHRLGLLVDGAEGRSLVGAAEAYMTTHRVKRPEKMARMLLPFAPR